MSMPNLENPMVIDRLWSAQTQVDDGAMTTQDKINEWKTIVENDPADFIVHLSENYQEILQPLIELTLDTPINCSVTDSKIRFLGKQIDDKRNEYCRSKAAEEGY